MTGEDRAWLYTLAMLTGLRRGELQSLSPESFNLEGSPAVVSLPGLDTNSDDAVQPLPPTSFHPYDPGWPASPWGVLAATRAEHRSDVRTDLKAAGIAPEAFDFHCLRHSYVSAIVQCGGSVKDSMELARHHDADLTFGRYAHTRLADLSQVVDRLPSLWEDSSHTLPTSGVSTGLNGTTLETMKPCPEQSQVDTSGYDDQFWRLIRLSERNRIGGSLEQVVDLPGVLEAVASRVGDVGRMGLGLEDDCSRGTPLRASRRYVCDPY